MARLKEALFIEAVGYLRHWFSVATEKKKLFATAVFKTLCWQPDSVVNYHN